MEDQEQLKKITKEVYSLNNNTMQIYDQMMYYYNYDFTDETNAI